MNTEEKQSLLDEFAKAALQALITKAPFLDAKGEIGEAITPDALSKVKYEICTSAYEYAGLMLISRENSKNWLIENIDKNESFAD